MVESCGRYGAEETEMITSIEFWLGTLAGFFAGLGTSLFIDAKLYYDDWKQK